MGAYINPENETKEEFLRREATMEVSRAVAEKHGDFEMDLLVALVDNGNFTAAGLAFDAGEREDFTTHQSIRAITYFIVPKEKLLPVSNLEEYLR